MNSRTRAFLALIDAHRNLLNAFEGLLTTEDVPARRLGVDTLAPVYNRVAAYLRFQADGLLSRESSVISTEPSVTWNDPWDVLRSLSSMNLPEADGYYIYENGAWRSFGADEMHAYREQRNVLDVLRDMPQPTQERPPHERYMRPRGAPRMQEPAAEIAFTDNDGVPWRRQPDYTEAWSVDEGQHDSWKIELRVALHRYYLNNYGKGQFDLKNCGLPARTIPVGHLFPLEVGLAQACRRLGFVRLARAAFPEVSDDVLQRFYLDNENAVHAEAERRHEINVTVQGTWDPARGPRTYETVDETVAMLTAGPFEGPFPPFDKIIQPLIPLSANQE